MFIYTVNPQSFLEATIVLLRNQGGRTILIRVRNKINYSESCILAHVSNDLNCDHRQNPIKVVLGAPQTKIAAGKFWNRAQFQHKECAVGKKWDSLQLFKLPTIFIIRCCDMVTSQGKTFWFLRKSFQKIAFSRNLFEIILLMLWPVLASAWPVLAIILLA